MPNNTMIDNDGYSRYCYSSNNYNKTLYQSVVGNSSVIYETYSAVHVPPVVCFVCICYLHVCICCFIRTKKRHEMVLIYIVRTCSRVPVRYGNIFVNTIQ